MNIQVAVHENLPLLKKKMFSFFRFLFVSISNSKNDKLSWVSANGDSCVLLLNTSGAQFGTSPVYIARKISCKPLQGLVFKLKCLIWFVIDSTQFPPSSFSDQFAKREFITVWGTQTFQCWKFKDKKFHSKILETSGSIMILFNCQEDVLIPAVRALGFLFFCVCFD